MLLVQKQHTWPAWLLLVCGKQKGEEKSDTRYVPVEKNGACPQHFPYKISGPQYSF